METIKIFNIDTKLLIFDSYLKFDFILISDFSRNIKVEIFDPFFNIKFIPGEHTLTVSPNMRYWVGFEVDKSANLEKINLKSGVRILITCIDNNEVLYDDVIRTNYNPLEMRDLSFDYPIDSKRIWIIGDSNAWSSFGGYEYKPINIAGYHPVRVGITSLSLNRFIKGDHTSLIKSLPIYKNDIVVFYLGEIDFRYTIHKVGGNLSYLTKSLCDRYLYAISNIKKQISNNIVIMCPNPPMREGHIERDSINSFILGTNEERKLCWSIFDKFFSNINIEGVKYLNWVNEYVLNDSLIDTSKLFDKNHHIKDYNNCIDNLEIFLKNNYD